MGRCDKLAARERIFKIVDDLPLPFWVQVKVDLVN